MNNVPSQAEIQQYIIQSFNPTQYGISSQMWYSMSSEDKQKIFQKHAIMMNTRINMISNRNAQIDRMTRLQGVQESRNMMYQLNDAKQKASIIQQQQLNSMN